MKTGYGTSVSLIALFFFATLAAQEPEQKFASLGDFRLENGQVIKDCRIGYRTVGDLDASKSNAVLFATWYTGTTRNLIGFVGPGKLVDSAKYCVILVDSLGDGVSSSPSNSTAQPRMQFPRFSIRDMVRAEHELLTKHLGIGHLYAVTGISMGGMQSFEWIVSYPSFVDKAIPIVGAPRLTSYDLMLWSAQKLAIESDPAWNGGNYTSPPPAGMAMAAALDALNGSTPEYRASQIAAKDFPDYFQKARQRAVTGFDANDQIRQLEAMMSHDISVQFGGDMEKAAATVRAKVLVVVSTHDHMVIPIPALEFARMIFAPTVELNSICGHQAFRCDQEKLSPIMASFLAR